MDKVINEYNIGHIPLKPGLEGLHPSLKTQEKPKKNTIEK